MTNTNEQKNSTLDTQPGFDIVQETNEDFHSETIQEMGRTRPENAETHKNHYTRTAEENAGG